MQIPALVYLQRRVGQLLCDRGELAGNDGKGMARPLGPGAVAGQRAPLHREGLAALRRDDLPHVDNAESCVLPTVVADVSALTELVGVGHAQELLEYRLRGGVHYLQCPTLLLDQLLDAPFLHRPPLSLCKLADLEVGDCRRNWRPLRSGCRNHSCGSGSLGGTARSLRGCRRNLLGCRGCPRSNSSGTPLVAAARIQAPGAVVGQSTLFEGARHHEVWVAQPQIIRI
mmetsp:Transcript_83638/g.249566  ORF Transcript_83638/g.249566 Transcript_83638/m.249566 type:complete len:228 (+) Transcript_83638:617-1300(+)